MNKIIAENLLEGSPSTEWDVVGAGSPAIQGFATEISVNVGETVWFKVSTMATAYRLDVYRMGYYGGAGARQVARLSPFVALPQMQPPAARDTATGLVDCGTWDVSAQWAVPSDATSGIYFAKLVRGDGVPGESHIVFVVRDDDEPSDLLFQTSDTTWQAYNAYGDSCLYEFLTATNTRAAKVSYNRPFLTRDAEFGADWVFNAEYPMVRWLEANGYDVSYCAGVDTDRRGDRLLQHRIFLSVGHDEYWSGQQRAHVEAARDAGVHLAFLSGNEVFWKVRWEDSIDGSANPHRTLVCYKEPTSGAKTDPSPDWTGLWRDPRLSPPSDGGRPENALTGTIFGVQGFSGHRIAVPAEDGRLRFWRDTDIAGMAPGAVSVLSEATLGFEWDEELDNGARPPGLMHLSTTKISTPYRLLDVDLNFGSGRGVEHHLTLYRHTSGALVFSAGTAQWTWALDGAHLDGTHYNGPSLPDLRAGQAMVNLFADMGVQPVSLQAGLVLAVASTDTTAPTSVITSPTEGDNLPPGAELTITGTASDADGVVGAVEVSVDGGLTWHPATGRESWSFPWTPSGNGVVTLLSRAVDDSGNLEAVGQGVIVTIGPSSPAIAPGGPVLVIVNGSYSTNPYGKYLTEILRTEGLMLFSEIELGVLIREPDPAALLADFPVVVLAETRLLPAQQDILRSYVSSGGNLVAMRPDPALSDLFGLSNDGPRTEELQQFLAFDSTSSPGDGLTAASIQYHGPAYAYTTTGASVLAAFWDDIETPSNAPAVTLFETAGGRTVAFAFDLAKSLLLTRHGNPEWADTEGDAFDVTPAFIDNPDQYRPMDMFARLDSQIWFAPERLLIPQADEQQRFFANIILGLLARPVPRLWYLPGTHRRLIVNTGDTCYSSSSDRDTMLLDAAARDAVVTLYLQPEQMAQVDVNTEAGWRTDGHDTGVHVSATPTAYGQTALLRAAYDTAVTLFEARYSHAMRSSRNHTIDWVGWVEPAKFEAALGTELDLNYYHYWNFGKKTLFPQLGLPTGKEHTHGYFTGSGLPQRFCDENGAILPIFQLLTEWPDEFFADNGFTALEVYQIIEEALTAAQMGSYSAFVTNIHPVRYTGADPITGPWARALWEHARDLGIPVWTAAHFLDFTNARQLTRFNNLSWDGATLHFDVSGPAAGDDITVVLPAKGLISLSVDAEVIHPAYETISGRSTAFLTALTDGAHVAARYA